MNLNTKKIHEKFIEAQKKSIKINNSILLSITDSIDVNPFSLIDLDDSSLEYKVYWSQPSSKYKFLGLGTELELDLDSSDKDRINTDILRIINNKIELNEVGRNDKDTITDITDQTPPNIPTFVGGQSFDINRPSKNIWKEFPLVSYKIPKIIILKNDIISTISYNFMVDANIDFNLILNQINERYKIISNAKIKKNTTFSLCQEYGYELMNRKSFNDNIKLIKNDIKDSTIEKIIIANISQQSYKGIKTYNSLLLKLEEYYPECTIFLFDYSNKGAYIGASPEKILSINNENLMVDALAGSMEYTMNRELLDKFARDSKIRDEHNIVVMDIVERLTKMNIKTKVGQKNLFILKNIIHLKTLITAKIKKKDILMDILDSLSPTPALSGYPKDESIKIINQIEYCDRGWYTGALGWIDDKLNCEFIAGLRSVFITKDKLYIYGGAGITKDSIADDEWNEIFTKIHTIGELIHWMEKT